MTYQKTAQRIIKDSIKSAVFIDEKALPFYDPIPSVLLPEQEMSKALYNNFKEDGITVDIHKFQVGDENNENLKDYLFEKRDLVLLDWKLNDNEGEEYSLKLLEDIVNREHIHFCTVYTSLKNLDDVFWNIQTYFSDESKEYYKELRLELEAEDGEEIIKLLPYIKGISANRFQKDIGKEYGIFYKDHKELMQRIISATDEKKGICALIKAGIAFSNTLTAEEGMPCPSSISEEKKTLIINNTVITILNKSANKPKDLLSNFSSQISDSNYSFLHLLGLEAHQVFTKKAAFIDSELLSISKDAFIYHKEQKKESFEEFIKEVLFEKARLNFRGEKISLLDDELWEELMSSGVPTVDNKELQKMNIFYNSIHISGNKELSFGDVFKNNDNYFICITALCDCLTPKKNVFYFAEGKKIKLNSALKLGDGAFISYLPTGEIVQWADINNDSANAPYMPIYIKPIQFVITDKHISEGKLKMSFMDEDANTQLIHVEYVATIKENYTQRIANHAFTHPSRVGIDFVKKN